MQVVVDAFQKRAKKLPGKITDKCVVDDNIRIVSAPLCPLRCLNDVWSLPETLCGTLKRGETRKSKISGFYRANLLRRK